MKTFACTLIVAAISVALLPAESIPKGAVEIQPRVFRYTDAHGKQWLYRQTPFGISKGEDVPAAPQTPVESKSPVHATDLGSSVRFERVTPFGISRWVRPKSELTAEEKSWLKEAANPAAAQDKIPEIR